MNMPETILPTENEMNTALESMFKRMDDISIQAKEGFPIFSPKDSNQWLISRSGSWTGGFWAGLWWLRAKMTGSASDREKAEEICTRLEARLNDDTVNRSLIFWHGAALGKLWLDNDYANDLALKAADEIAGSFDAKMQCIPLGSAMGGGERGNQAINIDSFAALVQLLGLSGQTRHKSILLRNAESLINALGTDKGAFHAHAHFNNGLFEPQGIAGNWSRGQAWAMLGLAQAAKHSGEPYLLSHALKACEYWQFSRGQALTLNRLLQPEKGQDASATVIAALAMRSLGELLPDGKYWHNQAHGQIKAVLDSPYFDDSCGIFWGCCYKTRREEELVESSWGSFLLMQALSALSGKVGL